MVFPDPDDGIRIANLDGATRDNEIVEAKTTTIADEWGDQLTDQVPERVLAQVHHQLGVAGPDFRVAYIPVLLPGFKSLDFRLYRVERNDELVAAVAAAAVDFMENHIRPELPPDDFRPSLEVAKRIRREPDVVVDIPEDLFTAYKEAQAAASAAEKAKKAAQAELLAALGTAEGGSCALGSVTYLEQTRKSYTVAESTYRVLRLKKR